MKKALRKMRSLGEIRKASNHLHYEIAMLSSVAEAIALQKFQGTNIGNALLESFLIHARLLKDFLYSNNPHEGDVIAEDFFERNEKWISIWPELSSLLNRLKGRVGKEVAHLTYDRINVTPDEILWPVIQIKKEIIQVINMFLRNSPKDKLGSKCRQLVEGMNASPSIEGRKNQSR